MKFTDIKVDFDNIFLKCAVKSDKDEDSKDQDFAAVFTIAISKESNIGMKTAKFNSHFAVNDWSKIH